MSKFAKKILALVLIVALTVSAVYAYTRRPYDPDPAALDCIAFHDREINGVQYWELMQYDRQTKTLYGVTLSHDYERPGGLVVIPCVLDRLVAFIHTDDSNYIVWAADDVQGEGKQALEVRRYTHYWAYMESAKVYTTRSLQMGKVDEVRLVTFGAQTYLLVRYDGDKTYCATLEALSWQPN